MAVVPITTNQKTTAFEQYKKKQQLKGSVERIASTTVSTVLLSAVANPIIHGVQGKAINKEYFKDLYTLKNLKSIAILGAAFGTCVEIYNLISNSIRNHNNKNINY